MTDNCASVAARESPLVLQHFECRLSATVKQFARIRLFRGSRGGHRILLLMFKITHSVTFYS